MLVIVIDYVKYKGNAGNAHYILHLTYRNETSSQSDERINCDFKAACLVYEFANISPCKQTVYVFTRSKTSRFCVVIVFVFVARVAIA